jgi:site-specific DNA-methyltransferase (adenine-specific)
MIEIYNKDNLEVLKTFKDKTFNLIYVDPPFNTSNIQKRTRSKNGVKIQNTSAMSYNDKFDDFIKWIRPRIEETKRILTDNGSFFIHMDYREIHYVKILCDEIFGRENFINEIIWTYDFGVRQKKKWATKHENILWYAKDHKNYIFNYNDIDRVPYKAPGLVRNTAKNAEAKIKRGKTVTDSWTDVGIVHTLSKEKTSYPTQKPLKLLERIVKVHSNPGDKLLDYFAGAGSFGEAAIKHNRDCVLIDNNPQALQVMKKRFPQNSIIKK